MREDWKDGPLNTYLLYFIIFAALWNVLVFIFAIKFDNITNNASAKGEF